jgi:hypothetical protein
MCTRFHCLAVILVFAVSATPGNAGDEVTANNPLIPPLFSIDPASPEVAAGWFLPGDLLLPTGPNIPTVEVPAANLSLFAPNDDLDALAFEGWDVALEDTFVVIFSVDREALGGVPPDPGLASLGFPFNVQDQAALNQAAGDLYMSLLLFDRFGYIPARPRSHSANNTLVVNQGDAGGVDTQLDPRMLSPTLPAGPGQHSNLNGGAGTQPPPAGLTLDHEQRSEPPDWLLFSLAIGSPSLATLPGTGSAADIYEDTNPGAPGGEALWVNPLMLGLTLEDDIDALTVFDDGDRVFEEGFDQIVFSLAPGSPSLGGIFGPGDLFTSEGFGVFWLYCPGDQLGLGYADNLNMLDYVLCEHVLSCAYYWAIGYPSMCMGDINGDGQVNLIDLGILLASYNLCQGDPDYYPGADVYGDDDCVSLADLGALLAHYGQPCPP